MEIDYYHQISLSMHHISSSGKGCSSKKDIQGLWTNHLFSFFFVVVNCFTVLAVPVSQGNMGCFLLRKCNFMGICFDENVLL